ncbi:sensor histidine kinase [Dyadobacter sp. CY323]|uniref:tetratricopeptide repeat-containing sensor histidine kinase n=1 Tax=Dyadobacter sp. CY323 TaxID=2907302 RepID=UPI001F20A8EE|nr:sensor histidine kinase [Dyadobacter sp. CY323]MCE6989809.1 sensor histidine kinase [Dyadobacter sp. CY323]
MMKTILFFLCLCAHLGYCQVHEIDNLKKHIERLRKAPLNHARDSIFLADLEQVMRLYTNINIDSAKHYADLMIRFCEKRGIKERLIFAYQYTGYLHLLQGDNYASILSHFDALAIAENQKEYLRMARSYGALAHAYANLKEYEKAEKFCKKGLAVLSTHPDKKVYLSILNVYGEMYRGQRRFPQALKVSEQMYRFAKANHVPWYEAQGLHTIGWACKEMRDMSKALRFYKEAATIARKTGSIDLESGILLHISEVYTDQKNWREALHYCNLAKQSAKSVKNGSIVTEAEDRLYQIFKKIGQPARALASYESFIFLRDSLSREKKDQRIKTLQAQYDNVKKTNELQTEQNRNQQLAQTRNGLFLGITVAIVAAVLLFWNNKKLASKNREIEHQRTLIEEARTQLADANKNLETRVEERTMELVIANQELIYKNEEIKTALFKGQTIERKRVALELHDNLSSLLSAVNMTIQSINTQNLSEAEQSVYKNLKHLIKNAYAEVRNISHNILPSELEKEGLTSTLTTLVGQLNQNSRLQFSLSIVGLNERMPMEIEFNIYSIVWELINNAIKHAQASNVGISLCRTECDITLTVVDDGIGFVQTNSKRGIGLQNIQTRLESLGGTYYTPPIGNTGTQIQIKIPIESV